MTTAQLPIIIPTAAEFRAWLMKRQNKRVGFIAGPKSCPLANWLRTVNGRRKIWAVGSGEVCAAPTLHETCHREYPMPQWASDFIHGIDAIPYQHGQRSVMGSQAIAVLDKIEAD